MESRAFAIAALIVGALVAPADAQRAIDGEILEIDATRWRLWGIDAPEKHQACSDGWAGRARRPRL